MEDVYFYTVREGANSQKITNVEEIRELFQQAEKIYYDSIPSKKYNIYKHLDADMLKAFRRESHISNNVDDEQLLENIQAFTENGEVKRGAILFFAKHPEELFFHAIVRCTQFKGTDKLHIIDDKTFQQKSVQQATAASLDLRTQSGHRISPPSITRQSTGQRE